MKKRILFFCFSAVFLWAQETPESVRRQTKAVESETAREKQLHDAEKKRHQEFVETGRKKVSMLNEQRNVLSKELDSLKAELARYSEARSKAVSTARWYESRKVKYQEALASVIDSLVPFLRADYPYRNGEAAENMTEIASQLRKGVIHADDALSRALEVLRERLQMGYSAEVWSGFLDAESKSYSGKFLRYGAVAGIFVSADGNDVFWLSRNEKGDYRWVSAGDNYLMRNALKESLRVAEGKSAPRLVKVPVSVPKGEK